MLRSNLPLPARRGAWMLAIAGSTTLGIGLAIGLGATPKPGAAATTLRWKFRPGDVLRYSMDQKTVMTTQDPMGKAIKQTTQMILDMTWTIKSVDASGVASVTQRIDRVRTSAEMVGGKFSSDSNDLVLEGGTTNLVAPLFKVLVGAEFGSKMDPRGILSEIKLSDKLLAVLKEDEIGALGQFSEAGLKNTLAQMVTPLPEQGVEVGQAWPRTMAIPAGPSGETRQVEQTFTFKGPQPGSTGLVAIDFTTKFEPPKVDPNVPATFKKESANGRIEFDNAIGRIAKSTTVEEAELSFKIDNREIENKVETTRTFSLTKDKTP